MPDKQTAAFPIRPRWLNRTVFGIAMASLFSDLSHEVVTVLLPSLLGSMGAAAAVLGIIEGVSDGLASFAKLFGGWLADRVTHRKRLAAGGYGVMAVSPLVIAAAVTWPVVLAGRVIAWTSRGLRTPSRKALLADAVQKEFYGRAFGFERAMDTTGAILAPVAVYFLIAAHFGPRTLIAWSALPAALAVIAILMVRERGGRRPMQTPFLRSFHGLGGPFKRFVGAVGLFGLGDFADSFFILYAVGVLTPVVGAGAAAATSVALYALHNVLYAGWSYFGGWLSDHMNKRALLATGYAIAAIAPLGMLAGVNSRAGLAVMFALAGTGIGIYEAVEDAIAAYLVAPERRGSGFGALAVVTGLGDFVSSMIFGGLWSVAGLRVAALGASIPMLAGAVLIALSARRREVRLTT